jgi:ubiquinone/menaquinone biosynthesis C-methylase UbiE
MIGKNLYKKSRIYDFFMRSFGYEQSIRRFLKQVDLPYTGAAKVLDAGCGTGILGLSMLARFPEATLVATDLEPNFLLATLSNAKRWAIGSDRIQVGISNITDPAWVTMESHSVQLKDNSFDIICLGGVIAYSACIETSLNVLVRLLKPGGTLVDLDMSESPAARFVAKRYDYANLPLTRLVDILRVAGCEVAIQKLGLKHMPASLTRTGIIARKQPAACDSSQRNIFIGPN